MIILISTNQIDDEIQLVRFTLTRDGEDYPFTANYPIMDEAELLTILQGKEDQYWFRFLKIMYPDHPNIQTLEDMGQWIANGCWINEEIQVEKVEWPNKHPIETDFFDRCKPSKESIAKLDALITKIPEAQIIKDLLIK